MINFVVKFIDYINKFYIFNFLTLIIIIIIMKTLKFSSLVFALIGTLFCFLLISCSDDDKIKHPDNEHYVQFFEEFNSSVPSMLSDNQIIKGNKTRSHNNWGHGGRTPKDSIIIIDAEIPVGMPDIDWSNINTCLDLLELVNTYNASLNIHVPEDYEVDEGDGNTTTNTAYSTYTFGMSNSDALSSLSVLILQSRAYLRTKNMTDADIDAMISENNVDEGALVELAFSMAEQEKYEYDNRESFFAQLNMSDFFCLKANAAIDWRNVGNCALQVLGAHALYDLYSIPVARWTMSLVKQAFTVIAQKYIGAVGAVISVIEFSVCVLKKG